MAEYVDKNALLDEICRDNCERPYDGKCHNCRMTETIADFPAADVAEVVRCKDCKYRADRLYCRLRKTPYIVTNLDFCSYGEPLEG